MYVSKPEDKPSARSLAGERSVRSICDGVDEMQPVELYDGTLGVPKDFVDRHQRPVGQIQWNDDLREHYDDPGNVSGIRWASGTLIDRDLFLTAGHAFDSSPGFWKVPRQNGTDKPIIPPEIARRMQVNFNYQVTPSGNLRREESFPILELLEYRYGGLDYAIVRLGGNPGDKYGFTPISKEDGVVREMLCIIQHPEGLPKRIEAGPLTDIHSHQMGYDSIDTLGGSSGSGILSAATGKIVGVHTRGGCHLSVIGHNHGVRIGAIKTVSPAIKALLSPGWIHLDLHQAAGAPKIKSDPSFFATPGNLHVIFRSSGGLIHELRRDGGWHHYPISAGDDQPKAQGNPTGYALFGNRTRYVTFLGRDQHIHHLWYDGAWHHVDVTEEAEAPEAASEATPHISFDGNSQQLYFAGSDGHLYLLWWGGSWHHAALSAATNAAPAAGRPAVCGTARDEHLYVVYRGRDNHLHLLHREENTWTYTPLSEQAHAPKTTSDPVAILLMGDQHPRVYYRNKKGHILKIHWVGRWLYADLSAAAVAPPSYDAPALVVAPDASFATILFRNRDRHIMQLEWDKDHWQNLDLSEASNAPAARGTPAGIIRFPTSSRTAVFRGKDNHLHEISWEG